MNRAKKLLGILKAIASVLWWTITLVVLAAVVGIMAKKIKGEIPYFFGYSIMNVVSGSMEDTIPEHSYILIQKTDPAEIRKGDIICFFSDDPAIKGFPNTHTVVEDPIHTEHGIEFVTKGDANPVKDSETAKGDKLIGRYVKRLDALTKFSRALDGGGMLIISSVLPALCAICMIASVCLKAGKGKDDESGEAVSDPDTSANPEDESQK
jgi:signal peptidase I